MTVLKPARRLEPRLGREADKCLDSRPPLLRSWLELETKVAEDYAKFYNHGEVTY